MDDTTKMEIVKWSVMGVLAALFAYSLYSVDSKLSVLDLFLMMPPWCKLTRYPDDTIYVSLSPGGTACFMFATFIVLYVLWYLRETEYVEKMEEEVQKKEVDDKWENTEEVLLDNTECLIDKVDMERRCCADGVAANNETPGERVGGEVEWALGETSSEEDATREVTGARVRRSSGDPEAGDIMKFLQEPVEPHLKAHE